MSKLTELFKKYKHLIFYVFFGVCTTAINWVTYYLFYNVVGVPNLPSNIIAWVVAVAFAFVTNKLWVFESKSTENKTLIYEIFAFISARLATGLLDLAIMYVTVDVLEWNSSLFKLISNIIVIITNYGFSKFVVFRKGKANGEEKS